MIATASLALSKRLHELAPEWDDTEKCWYFMEDYDCVEDSEDIVTDYPPVGNKKVLAPAPDLDWLLGKLPAFINSKSGIGYKLYITVNVTSSGSKDATIGYQALRQVDKDRKKGFEFLYHPKIKFQHGTSCDAACALLIKLLESGGIKV